MSGVLAAPPRVVSVGLDLFAEELTRAGVPVIQLAWSPPAGGDPRLTAMLERLAERAEQIERANDEVLTRLVGGEPRLIDCRPAWEALELPERVVLEGVAPERGFVRFSQGFDADETWPTRVFGGAAPTGTVTIDGITWDTYDLNPSATGNISVGLATQASMLLGREGQPADLDGAREMISILEMLRDKTEGRRTAEEDQVLESILYELRMAYLKQSGGGAA